MPTLPAAYLVLLARSDEANDHGSYRPLSLQEVHARVMQAEVSRDHYAVFANLTRKGFLVRRWRSPWTLPKGGDPGGLWKCSAEGVGGAPVDAAGAGASGTRKRRADGEGDAPGPSRSAGAEAPGPLVGPAGALFWAAEGGLAYEAYDKSVGKPLSHKKQQEGNGATAAFRAAVWGGRVPLGASEGAGAVGSVSNTDQGRGGEPPWPPHADLVNRLHAQCNGLPLFIVSHNRGHAVFHRWLLGIPRP